MCGRDDDDAVEVEFLGLVGEEGRARRRPGGTTKKFTVIMQRSRSGANFSASRFIRS